MNKSFLIAMMAGILAMSYFGHSWAKEDVGQNLVAECVKDNAKEGQTPQVVDAYCKCMVELMPEKTNKSVSKWEKKHRKEEEQCSAKAGWKSR